MTRPGVGTEDRRYERKEPNVMHWDDRWNGGPGWWWLVGFVMMIAFWGGLAWVVVSVTRHTSAGGAQPPTPVRQSGEEILQERLARGEIDVDEYDRRLAALRKAATPH